MKTRKLKSKGNKKGKNRSKHRAKQEFEGLPTEQSVPIASIDGYSWFLYGLKKIGKTTLSVQFPNSFHMMFEPGAKALNLYKVDIENWAHAWYLAKKLKKDKGRFKTICVDTADIAYEMCQKSVCEELVIDHPADEGWGKGWDALRQEFTRFVNYLLKLDKGVIFISHAKEASIKGRSGEEWNVMQPTVKNTGSEILNGLCDILGYYSFNGDRRVLQIVGDDFVTAGHRLNSEELGIEAFSYKGIPVKKIDMGDTAQEGFKHVVDCFNNQYEPPKVKKKKKKSKRIKKRRRD